ncbi:hypothetical protein ACWDOP_11180 [Nocardia sp. NPDC003693]
MADEWNAANTNLSSAATKTLSSEVNISESEVGLFTDFYEVYRKVPGVAYFLLTEGAEVSRLLGSHLRNGYELYKHEEETSRDEFRAILGG